MAGCSAPVEQDEVAEARSPSTQGVVLVERQASAESTQVGISAKFMRVPGSVELDSAQRLVGSRLDQPAVGACAVVGASDPVAALPHASHAAIELLDVGELAVQVDGGQPIWLVTRAFPDVGDLVSGVFYTTRDDAAALTTGSFLVSSSGSSQLDHFEVAAAAPADLDEVRLDDDLLTDGPALVPGRSIAVRWQAADEPAAEDRVFIDVTGASGVTTRCAYGDVGEATLRGDVLDEQALGSNATIEVHRVRRSFFGTNAIDAGEIRFDLSVLGRVTFERAAE
ncbi:MAG TPA: hypothetical protein VGM56_32200 [Byssovorax sp.]